MRWSHLFSLLFICCFLMECQSQQNESRKYIGEDYGSLDLDQTSFDENLDTLFSDFENPLLRNRSKDQ